MSKFIAASSALRGVNGVHGVNRVHGVYDSINLLCASPIQPRLSRCGQSVGMLHRFVRCMHQCMVYTHICMHAVNNCVQNPTRPPHTPHTPMHPMHSIHPYPCTHVPVTRVSSHAVAAADCPFPDSFPSILRMQAWVHVVHGVIAHPTFSIIILHPMQPHVPHAQCTPRMCIPGSLMFECSATLL